MSISELAHLELSVEIDELTSRLRAWADGAPDWPAARGCQRLVARLLERADALRVRLEAPLVVALLGGTGTGKSTLVNALCGADVTVEGRQRPTTLEPVLIARPGVLPELLGIDPRAVRLLTHEAPLLANLVLVDCPDPDTTDDENVASDSNLARLRAVLPHCDVLLVAGTQQKYRDARVMAELAAAAPGARLVFVQTHGDIDDDIRADWRRALGDSFATGEMFLVDAPAARLRAEQGLPPSGEFARLVELLSHELARSAVHRIRRANFLDLAQATLATCHARVAAGLPAVAQLERAVQEQRGRLAAKLAQRVRDELAGSRRLWESRLAAEVAARWGFSPFALVLRVQQGLGGLLAGAALFKARTPAQMALWGAVATGRTWRQRRRASAADANVARAAMLGWEEHDLRTAAIILDGYAAEANLARDKTQTDLVAHQAQRAGRAFTTSAAAELQSLVCRLAARHAGWWGRAVFEAFEAAVLAIVAYRWGKNFFFDSWLADPPRDLLDLRFFVHAALWITLASAALAALFTSRLRRGLDAELAQLAASWGQPAVAAELFAPLEHQARSVARFHDELERLSNAVAAAQARVAAPDPRLGRHVETGYRANTA